MLEPPCWRAARRPGAALALALALFAGGCSSSSDSNDGLGLDADSTADEAGPQIRYEATIEGVEDSELHTLLEGVSDTVRLADRPPPSLIRLRRRAEDDRPRLQQALRSRGYYDARIAIALDPSSDPVQVKLQVDPGPEYRFRNVRIDSDPPAPPPNLPGPEALKIAPGEPALSQIILDAENALLAAAKAQGYALAELGQRQAVVDHGADAMDLTLVIKPGPVVHFGDITIDGLVSVKEDAVRRRLPWEPDELMTSKALSEGRQALFDSGLFSSVLFDLGKEPGAGGQLPVTVNLNERRMRSIGVGVRYRTDEGIGGNIDWEHRNLFGRGERLTIDLDGSFIGANLSANFRKPDFLIRDQALIADSSLVYADTDAYKSLSAGASAGLERLLAPGMTIAGSLAFRLSRVQERDQNEDESFGLLSLPVLFNWDRSNDLLNPTRGGRLALYNEPFVDVIGNDLTFDKSQVTYSHYFRVLNDPGVVLAGRASVGTLFGADRDAVPADLRFYAGGGGSVRGFGYQLAGPLDDDHNPIGGRSLFELSGEVRVRLNETIGVVGFVDAGTNFSSSVPNFSEPLRVGAGPGLRYFSPIGPVRLDIGIPVNKRDSDDSFQLYVSLGQAF